MKDVFLQSGHGVSSDRTMDSEQLLRELEFAARWWPTVAAKAIVCRASRLLYLQIAIILRSLAFRISLSFSLAMVPVIVT